MNLYKKSMKKRHFWGFLDRKIAIKKKVDST